MHSAAKAAENWSGAGPICAFPWLALTLQCPPPGTSFSELLKGSPLETKLMASSFSFWGGSSHSAKHRERSRCFSQGLAKQPLKVTLGTGILCRVLGKGKQILLTQISHVHAETHAEIVGSK